MRQIVNHKKYWLLVLLGLFLFLLTTAARAYNIEVSLPGITAEATTDPGAYVRYLFIFGLSLAGFLAVGAIAWGGIQYMAAGTSLTSVQKAKDLILGALGGIALLLCSWLILTTIDPSLTNLTPLPQDIRVGDIAAPATVTPSPTPTLPVTLDFSWHCPDEGGGLYANQNECNNSCVAACVQQGPGP